ncbi:MAG: hypothetical protein R2725_14395 [Solirubrobacterales bacterium]
MEMRGPRLFPPLATAALFTLLLLLTGCGSGGGRAATARAGGPAGGAPTCDGAAALCGKRLDQVVFPGTHNSFAAADEPGWYFANQRFGIGRQLDDGIRALLLDLHYGVRAPDGLVRTDFSAQGAEANKVVKTFPARARQAAERIAGPLGAGMPAGEPRLYLCHTLCELGAEPLDRELSRIAAFLGAHPRAFLVLIIEDYVSAGRVAAAFRTAGLARLAATLPLHAPQPTLGELLDEGKQLAVFSENRGGDPAWYMPAFSYIQDTPLGAHRPDQLSCARFRGDPDSPLLLVNYWIPPFPPSPSLNAAIGRTSFLRHRMRRCVRERGTEGAIVAVDFYQRTSVVRVARELNEAGD